MTARPLVYIGLFASLALALSLGPAPRPVMAQTSASAEGPVFRDGQAQVVPAFAEPRSWVRHDLWVETEFDSDCSVCRTTVSHYFWNVRHEIGAQPPPRGEMPDIRQQSLRPVISNSHVGTWVPRGFAVVHSQSPGTGLSQGCPTVGGMNESLAPKAVIDWLNGRARGFTTPDGNE